MWIQCLMHIPPRFQPLGASHTFNLIWVNMKLPLPKAHPITQKHMPQPHNAYMPQMHSSSLLSSIQNTLKHMSFVAISIGIKLVAGRGMNLPLWLQLCGNPCIEPKQSRQTLAHAIPLCWNLLVNPPACKKDGKIGTYAIQRALSELSTPIFHFNPLPCQSMVELPRPKI